MNFRVYMLMTVLSMGLPIAAEGSAQGPFNVFSESTTLDISGWAQVPPQAMTNYSLTSMGNSLNGGVCESAPEESASAYSSAQLNATLSTSDINFSSELFVNTGGGPDGFGTGQYCYAEADYTFSLSFNVASAVMYNLTFSDIHGFGHQHTFDQQFTFSSAENGVLASQPELGPGYSGWLTPGDTYTIATTEEITADTPDFSGNEWTQDLGFDLTAVPEPSSALLFGAAAAAVAFIIGARNRRRKLT